MTATERIQYIQAKVGAIQDGIIGRDTLMKFQSKYNFINSATIAHFFGNMHHESGGFTTTSESLHYTSVARLRAVWPSRFPTDESAKPYINNSYELGRMVYGGRMGNDMETDGYTYRGRGLMQITGKASYALLAQCLNVDVVANPSLVATKYFFESAIHIFNEKKLWSFVDDVSEQSICAVRLRVNGGFNGLDDVRNNVLYYYNMF